MSSPRPPTVDAPATGNLTDDVVANATEHADAVVFTPTAAERRAGRDVTAAEFLDEVTAVAKGLVAAGVEPGDRVGADVPHPLRVDAARLRDLVRRRGHRADLRDLLAPSRSGGSCRTPAPGRWWSRRPSTSAGSQEVRDELDGAAPGVVDRGQRRRRARPARRRHRRRRARGAPYDGAPRRPGDPDLHLRHHRPAQGLHAHPRQLHVRARRRGRGARRAVRTAETRRPDPAVPAAGARLRPGHPGRLREGPRPAGPHRRHQEPGRRPRRVPADVRAGRPARVREGLQHRPPAGGRRRPGPIFDRAAEVAIA